MARTVRMYQVTRVAWVGPKIGIAVGRRLRKINIPPAPNNGRLTEDELSDYVDKLRVCVRVAGRRFMFGHLLKLRVFGTGGPEGTKVLGEAGLEGERLYTRSRPSLSSYRYYPYGINADKGDAR